MARKVKKSQKVGIKKTTVSQQTSLQMRLSSFFSNISSNKSGAGVPPSRLKIQKKYLFPFLGLVVLVILGWLASRYLVVAWVDNRPIFRASYYNQLDKKYGKDLREQLIVENLIDSEAKKRNINATDEEVANEIKKIEEEQGGASNLEQVLQMQGINRDELKKLVRLQILRQKMFANSSDVTEAEIKDYLEQNKTNLPEADPKDASAAANLRENVRNQLMQQKLNATFSSWLQENLNSDRVIRL